jgi:nondiscriminating glutamyl-tRNA synthetase
MIYAEGKIVQENFKNPNLKVRFAPAPTGLMHIGNIRTALINFLMAKQKNGIFVLRIEDTDPSRNYDPEGKKILEHLNWLSLNYDEGPVEGGPHAPYFQSKRNELYLEKLNELKQNGFIYQCFCTTEELEKKRARQIAMKKPPRYDRKCLELPPLELQKLIDSNTPFIWRMKVDPAKTITVPDIAKGNITFELKNFSDFPITRQDGSFTFTLANCIDDIEMGITHAFRGEDHLTNTVDQLIIFKALGAPFPKYWHMPLICNKTGKKLSKRDFGFSLEDLKADGFLPEAICNYLAIMGGSFNPEIQSLNELSKSFNFDNISSSGHIKYDPEKLRWINHKWIERKESKEIANLIKPFVEATYPEASKLDEEILTQLVDTIKTDLVTLKDATPLLKFYFEKPKIDSVKISNETKAVLKSVLNEARDLKEILTSIKETAKASNLKLKDLFPEVRYALTGDANGPSVGGIMAVLGSAESIDRLKKSI